jgi:hypothetical protein
MSGATQPATGPPAQPAVATEPPWAKTAISIFALGIFLAAFGIAYLAKDNTDLTMMMGAAISMATSVVGYWIGSSSGSDKKTAILAAPVTQSHVPPTITGNATS